MARLNFLLGFLIQVTQVAYKEIVRLGQRTQSSSPKLVIGHQLGGCLGQVYTLSFGEQVSGESPTPYPSALVSVPCELLESGGGSTRLFTAEELELSADADFLPLLENLVLDYSEDLMGGNFRFVNPNLSQTCSCGQSFNFPAKQA